MHSVENILDEVESVLVKTLGPGTANPNVVRQIREEVTANLKPKKTDTKEDKK